MNNTFLIGRLVRDPETRFTQNGKPVTNFSVAVDRNFTNQQGEREADFFDIVAWGKLAEIVGNNLKKGRLVAVQGRLQTRSYEAGDGKNRKVTEIVANEVRFLDKPKTTEDEIDFPDDDVPF